VRGSAGVNPYALLALAAAIALAAAGGYKVGVDHMKAEQLDRKELLEAVADEAANTAARAIAQLKPKYTTIQNEVQREIVTKTVYANCRHSPDGLLLANQAINGGAAPVGDRQLPKTDPAR
jgi:uncharacterized protein HemX